MITVKVSTYFEHDYLRQTPFSKGEIGNIRFVFDNSIDKCDIWVVWGGVKDTESMTCRANHFLFLTEEAFPERYYSADFLNKFDAILSCQAGIKHRRVIETPFIGISQLSSSYDEITNLSNVIKSKELSVICSDLFYLPLHRKRQFFVNALYGHFKKRIDLFGRGINPIIKKEDALTFYKYSIVIENDLIPGYHTEKLTDCFLTYTMPIYCGDNLISDLYPNDSMLQINIFEFEKCVSQIEEAISNDIYSDSFSSIVEARNTYLSQFHPFAKLAKVLEENFTDVFEFPLVENRAVPEASLFSIPYELTIHRDHKLKDPITIYTPDMGFIVTSRAKVCETE